MKILLCALEPSADALGAALMSALRDRAPEIAFIGCGGAQMQAEGLQTCFSVERLAAVGLTSALAALPDAIKAMRILSDLAEAEQPQAAIFIDSWLFSRMAAKRLREHAPAVRLIKYVAPQVWASRPHRAKEAASLFDGVICLFDFETRYFEDVGMRTCWAGHSGFDRVLSYYPDPEGFRDRHGVGNAPLLAVLPGSRRGELARHARPFLDVLQRIFADIPELRLALPAAPGLAEDVQAMTRDWPGNPVIVDSEDRYEAFAAANAALAASGTVTTELAIMGTPMVVAYRLDFLTELWAKRVITTPYASLVNIAAGKEILPEFVRYRCRPALIAPALTHLLRDENARAAQVREAQAAVKSLTGRTDPAGAAADAVLSWIPAGNAAEPIERERNGP